MPETSNRLPYPADTTTPDVPRDILALAEALPVHRVPTAQAIVTGAVVIASGQSSGSVAVAFPAGRFATAPRCLPAISGSSAAWALSVSGITASGCNVHARHIDANTAGGTVNVVVHAIEGLG